MTDITWAVLRGSSVVSDSVDLRRQLHKWPELGWTEFFATSTIRHYLLAHGVDDIVWGRTLYSRTRRVGLPPGAAIASAARHAIGRGVPPGDIRAMRGGTTGLIATLDSGREGPTIALRCDIDGLPVTESDGPDHVPAREGFSSSNPGVMHACGHDVHAATAAGLASLMRELRLPTRGRVKFIFQPAEEGTRGASALVDAGWLDDVDYFLAFHVTDRYGLRAGDVAAGVENLLATWKLDVSVTGKEAHFGVAPQAGRSALTVASSISLLAHAIPRRPGSRAMINVGRVEAGTARNIVPARGVLLAEIRADSDEEATTLRQGLERLGRGVAAAFGTTIRFKVVGYSPASSSDDELVRFLLEIVTDDDPVASRSFVRAEGSDDAALMMRHVQQRGGLATYLHVGTGGPSANHTPSFDVPEAVIGSTIAYLVRAADRLSERRVDQRPTATSAMGRTAG